MIRAQKQVSVEYKKELSIKENSLYVEYAAFKSSEFLVTGSIQEATGRPIVRNHLGWEIGQLGNVPTLPVLGFWDLFWDKSNVLHSIHPLHCLGALPLCPECSSLPTHFFPSLLPPELAELLSTV